MNRLTKVRPDAVLANQSAELQAAIYEMTLPGPRNRSYEQILEHLAKERGIRLGRSPLRRWREKYHLRERQADAEAAVQLAVEVRRDAHPEATAEALFAFGQNLLAVEAMEDSDVKAWAAIQKLRLATVDQAMAERKLVLLEKKEEREAAREAVA